MLYLRYSCFFVLVAVFLFIFPLLDVQAETIFIEVESLTTSSGGWKINENSQTRGASAVRALNGSSGDVAATASSEVIQLKKESETYRVWVRYGYHERFRGPFKVAAMVGEREAAGKVFDSALIPETKDWSYVWDYFDVPGSEPFKLLLGKHENKNCTAYVRNVDCFLITDDKSLVPDHVPYGPQTWLRVTLGDGYEEPLHMHVFADHYRSPWYSHWFLAKDGTGSGLQPKKDRRLINGEATPWCNITPMLYQDSGAILNISARYTYHERADRMKAKFEFATAADEKSIIRTFDIDSDTNGLVVVAPPNLLTEENLSRFKRDAEFAEATGKIADAFDWPAIGKKPVKFPFFVSATVTGYGTPVDQAIQEREWKTLSYFGFSNQEKHPLHGRIWKMKEKSYCRPDLEYMRRVAKIGHESFLESGGKTEEVVYCFLTDEPTGQPTAFLATDRAYQEAFRVWLKSKKKKMPADLLVADWDAVKPVPETDRDKFPGLYYYTQKFRTRALGDFMMVQKEILEKEYDGGDYPTMVNFSDGATYTANFCSQGVDYFELLDDDKQNGIWSEDWANGSSSYQCAAYNVDLMRAAAKDRGQVIGHYLIAHAGRKSWDIKTKAAGETARGVRIWHNFSYGTAWGSHEGGPAWKSHVWYNHPEVWKANAEVVREIGGVEDMIIDAKADPADVVILYSTSSDAWTVKKNHAFGFNRMHNWMALAHAQIPVDFLAERQVEAGQLDGRKVCYLSGPNLTRASAEKLRAWVEAGGTLVLSAGAAMRDEYNRPMDIISSIVPAKRSPVEMGRAFLNSGSYIKILPAMDTVAIGDVAMEVLSVQQRQYPKIGAKVLATFSDGSPAAIKGRFGKGNVHSAGFLPALDYIKKAELARMALIAIKDDLEKKAEIQSDHPAPPVNLADLRKKGGKKTTPSIDPRLERSYNPWEFSASVRDFLLAPVRDAKLASPLICSVPLIDALVLQAEKGIVIPLANHTLTPQKKVDFILMTRGREIDRVESIHRGKIEFKSKKDGEIVFSLPLAASDYIMVYFESP